MVYVRHSIVMRNYRGGVPATLVQKFMSDSRVVICQFLRHYRGGVPTTLVVENPFLRFMSDARVVIYTSFIFVCTLLFHRFDSSQTICT